MRHLKRTGVKQEEEDLTKLLKQPLRSTRASVEDVPGAGEEAILTEANTALLGYAFLPLTDDLPLLIEPGVHVNRDIDISRINKIVNALWSEGKRDREKPIIISIRRDLVDVGSLSVDRHGPLRDIAFTQKAQGARADLLAGNHRYHASKMYFSQVVRQAAHMRHILRSNNIDPSELTKVGAEDEEEEEDVDADADGDTDGDADAHADEDEEVVEGSQITSTELEMEDKGKGKGKLADIDIGETVKRYQALHSRLTAARAWATAWFDHDGEFIDLTRRLEADEGRLMQS